MIRTVIETWKIKTEKILSLTHDNARVMSKTAEILSLNSILCVLHTFNLVIKDAIRLNPDVEYLLSQVRSVVTFFNHSDPGRDRMKDLQKRLGIIPNNLIQDNDTR